MTKAKKTTKKTTKKKAVKKEPLKQIRPFPKGGAGSKIGKRLDAVWDAMNDRFSTTPIKRASGGQRKYSAALIATWIHQYCDMLPFPYIPMVEDFCEGVGMSKNTYYRYLRKEEEDGDEDVEGDLSHAHNRLRTLGLVRLMRAGESGLMHAGIQKNSAHILGYMDTDAQQVGKGVAEGIKGAGFFDLYKKMLDKDRQKEQKQRRKNIKKKKTGGEG